MLRRMHRRFGLIVSVALAIASVASPVSTVAQSGASPAPPAAVRLHHDVCTLVSPDELSAIHPDVILTLAISSPGACNYAGSPPDRPFAGAYLSVAARPASLADVALAGDVRDVTVAGSSGRVGPRDLIVGVGPWLLRINGIIPTADQGAWLVAAAEIVVPRLAALATEAAQGPVCGRLGAAAVRRIMGVPIDTALGDANSCVWSTGAGVDPGSDVAVVARVWIGDLATTDLAFKETEDVDVDGRRGVWVEDERRLYVESGSGGLLDVTFMLAPDELAMRDLAIALAAALFEAGVV